MFKKILPVLVLICGMGILYLRPVTPEQGLNSVMPFENTPASYGQYPAFEHHNQIYVLLTDTQGEIFNPTFLKTLRNVTRDLFYLPGVDRNRVTSLANVNVTYRDVIEDGFEGGPIIPEEFAYGEMGYDEIKKNILKSPYLGQLVSFDFKSALIVVPFVSAVDGHNMTREIKKILPHSERIHCAVLGYSPFSSALQDEIKRSLVAVLISWLVACLLFFLLTWRFSYSIILGPALTVVLQIILYSFVSRVVHPFVLPVILFTVFLSCINRMWNTWTITKLPPWSTSCAFVPGLCLYFLGSPLGMQMAGLCLAGVVSLLVTEELFLKDSVAPPDLGFLKPSPSFSLFPCWLKFVLLWGLLGFGLMGATTIFIGHRGFGPTILRSETSYQKEQKYLSDHFAFTSDSILLPAHANKESCTDPVMINRLEQIQWSLNNFSGVRFVSGLGETVKHLNMFFHENNIKWYTVPNESATLALATSQIDSKIGLFDDECVTLPMTIYLENHDPQTIAKVYKKVRSIERSPDVLTIKIGGGVAAFEAILNEALAASGQYLILFLVGLVLFVTCAVLYLRSAVILGFLFCVLLSLELRSIALADMGLNIDTAVGIVLGSCLCLYFFWLRLYHSKLRKKITAILILACVMLAGGLFSGVSFIFTASVIAERMLAVTWFLCFILFPDAEDLPDPSVKT